MLLERAQLYAFLSKMVADYSHIVVATFLVQSYD